MAERMRAVVKVDESPGEAGTAVTDRALPEIGPDEVLLRVRATSICGSDRHIFHWDPPIRKTIQPPRVYGHEFCGEVAEVGRNASRPDLRPGDAASAEMHVTCGTCYLCRTGRGHVCARTKILGFHEDGCFAEYVKVPAGNVIRLDTAIAPLRVGAFLDALGNAVHTIEDERISGDRVAILGYGPIGAMAAALAHHLSAAEIYVLDVSDRALAQARAWAESKAATNVRVLSTSGEAAASALQEVLERTGGGVDLVLEMSGAESAINMGLKMLRHGGRMSLLGIPSRRELTLADYTHDLIFKGVTLNAIIGRRMFSTWHRMLSLLESGLDVGFVVTREFPSLDHFHEGMALFDSHEALKVVFYPDGKGSW
ncbi:MAG: alcohol dehydrogenase catalytic domain-containing protein [Gemmatimonadetes bacterium]|nr:alcohol dehydrogenase catalytic domain-containing protein [Gemmatimonadota bacterium]